MQKRLRAYVGIVGEQGQQDVEGGAELGAADDAGHGVAVDRMDGEGQRRRPARRLADAGAGQTPHQQAEQQRHQGVQRHVDAVVAARFQTCCNILSSMFIALNSNAASSGSSS